MWAGHSWTAVLSIFPTQLEKKKTFHLFTSVNAGFLSGPQITWGDRVEMFTQAAGLERDITPVDEMFYQQTVLHVTCVIDASMDAFTVVRLNLGEYN